MTRIRRIDWGNTLFLTLTPIAAVAATVVYWKTERHSWALVAILAVFHMATSLSITAGYHRLFAHRTYVARPWVKFLYLVFGAAAFQNSALKWSTDHRRHHRFVDGEQDPYSINEGFFYAHMGWVCLKEKPSEEP